METAVKDWYLLGKADYCMSTTMDLSTFSQTSLSRSTCTYLSFKMADRCNVTSDVDRKIITSLAHERIMAEPAISPKHRYYLWKSLSIETVTRNFPCEDGVTPIYDGAVKAFWSFKDCKAH